MPRKSIPFSQMSFADLVATHNEIAADRETPPLKAKCGLSRCELVRRVAILNTKKPIEKEKPKSEPNKGKRNPIKRKQPIRDAILEALAFVSHYEHPETGERISKFTPKRKDGLLSVGLTYEEVAERVFGRCEEATKVSGVFLRWTAAMVRKGEPGFEKCKLPHKRPHGTKRAA